MMHLSRNHGTRILLAFREHVHVELALADVASIAVHTLHNIKQDKRSVNQNASDIQGFNNNLEHITHNFYCVYLSIENRTSKIQESLFNVPTCSSILV